MKTFLQLAQVRGPYCECGCNDFAHERHHCLIPQINKGGKVKYPILDDERNLVLVNHHTRKKTNSKARSGRRSFGRGRSSDMELTP
jgi:hypothetical protein